MMFPLAYWVHDFNAVILHVWGPLAVRWYGVAYVSGFIAFWLLFRYYRKKAITALTAEDIESLFNWGIVGVLAGGRLGFVLFYDLPYYLAHPLSVFNVTAGGMSFHGGLLGVIAAMFIICHKRGIQLFEVSDLAATAVVPGLFFGRMANFINGELWGKPSEVAWAVIFPHAPWNPQAFSVFSERLGYYVNPRHPSQLYEALLEGVLLFSWLQFRLWKQARHKVKATLSAEFLIGYALARIVSEHFREPDAALILGLSRGTFYSMAMLLAGFAFLFYACRKTKRLP